MSMTAMKKAPRLAAALVAAFALAGCMGSDTGPSKQQIGQVVGGIGGGILGNQVGKGSGNTVATIGGTLLGVWIGGSVGASMDRADQAAAGQAFNRATTAPIGRQIQWENPRSGNHGTVTPTRQGTDLRTGQYCREYQTTINVGGRTEQGYGTACQQPNGDWKIQP